MPRTPRTTTAPTRGRRSSTAQPIVSQISELVSSNERLQRDNRELRAENDRLRGELTEIGTALGRLTRGAMRGRGRSTELQADPTPRRRRKPITDPEMLERRRQALVRARAARAARLAAARAANRPVAEDEP